MYRVYTKFFLGLVFVILFTLLGYYAFYFLQAHFKPQTASVNSNTAIVPERFEEGKHYQKLTAKITTSPAVQQFIAEDPGKVQVMEFFGYPCHWCQRLHPYLNEWSTQKPENVVFYRFPVYFNKGWDTLAKAYYVVEKLGKNASLDSAFFIAIHRDHLNLGNEEKLEEFFAKQGVPPAQFKTLYHSFEVNRDYERANAIANAYEITISPAIIVNLPSGSYLITAAMAGSEQALIDILNFLIDRDLKPAQIPSQS